MDERLATLSVPSDGVWDEDGEWVWLPLSYGPYATRVKRLAFAGRGLPITPAREYSGFYDDIEVTLEHIRPGEPDEHGWAGSGDEMWWACNPEHPRAVLAWSVRFA